MGRKVFIVGVGMTKFCKPGTGDDYPELAADAGRKALRDAGVSYNDIQQVAVGYVYGDSTCGQRAVYQLGLTGVPVYNVNNNCSTGSTAVFMCKQLVEGGIAECVLALGFEKMERGSLGSKFQDRTNPMDQHMAAMMELRDYAPAPPAPQMFGNAGREHMDKYGTKAEHFAAIGVKNHKHSALNPYSQFHDVYTMQEIQGSPTVYEPLTKLQCCPTSDGAGAAVLCSEDFVIRHGLQDRAIEIAGMAMTTDTNTTFEDKSCMKIVGYDMTKNAAQQAFRQAHMSPNDVQVVELHDCFSANELITYEALGLCREGEAGKFIERKDNTYGGKYVVNPSGGLISKGHPLGATGLAQLTELTWQLRGVAGQRQVNGVRAALQHNIGLGGAVVVSVLRKGWPNVRDDPVKRHGYNPAVDARPYEEGRVIASGASANVTAAGGLKADDLFTKLGQAIKENPQQAANVKGVFAFDIKDGPGGAAATWHVDLRSSPPVVAKGKHAKPDITITVGDDDCVKLIEGKLNPQQAFMKGKVKLKGNMGLAMKLQSVLGTVKSKL